MHFVTDSPNETFIAAIADIFQKTSGDLFAVMESLLSHPATWAREQSKVRQPIEFVTRSLRALGVPAGRLLEMDSRTMRRWIGRPMTAMTQPMTGAFGPDGWPESAQDWITPHAMAGRITWAMEAPHFFLEALPDPRDFVHTALGPFANAPVIFAASAAESRSDGIGVVLVSPAFQRR